MSDTFTNRDLLVQVQPAIGVLANGTTAEAELDYDGAETTPVRYAVVQNERRVEDALEGYQEMLQEIVEEGNESQAAVEETLNALLQNPAVGTDEHPADQETAEELGELLAQETPFEPYTVSDAEIKAEPDVPLQVLGMADWMVE